MFRLSKSIEEPEPPLDATARQYARLGWHVTSRTVNAITMANESAAKDTPELRLTVDADGSVKVDGPPLPVFAIDGRMRAWFMLLLVTITVFAVAWALGFFR